MAYLNANIPPIYCKLRKEYLYDMDENKGEIYFNTETVARLLSTTSSKNPRSHSTSAGAPNFPLTLRL